MKIVQMDQTKEAPSIDIRGLEGFASLARELQHHQIHGSLVIANDDETSTKDLARRRHDVQGALRTLQLMLQSVQGGYRFDDDGAEAKIDATARAVQTLKKEASLLTEILTPQTSE